ncbi:MAG: hypothetical protein RLZZ245_1070 [Verrucomicrobiota bacterium]
MRLRFLSSLLAIALPAMAQDAAAPKDPEAPLKKPSVVQLDASRYQVGEVIFDRKNREIRFPCTVNMTAGLLEYLVVHENGKLHESLLATRTSPTDINLAFTLLRYPPSRELYPLPNSTGGVSGDFPVVPADIKAAARVKIDVEWQEDGKSRRMPVNDWIQHATKTTAMPRGPWVYGGSDFEDGKFVPEITGDIAAIFVIGYSLITYPGQDNNDDTVWLPFTKRIPDEGTNVTVVIAPYSNTATPLATP